MLGFQVSTIVTNFIYYLLRPYYVLALAEGQELCENSDDGDRE